MSAPETQSSRSKIATKSWIWGPLLLILAMAWVLVRTGVRPLLSLDDHLEVATAWPVLPVAQEFLGYTLSSPSGFLVYQIMGTPGKESFLWQQALVICSGIVVLSLAAIREIGSTHGWQAVRFLLLGSLGAVLVHWLGIYDSYTFLFWALLLLAWSFRSAATFAVAAFLLGFQHLNQAIFGLVAFFLAIGFLGFWEKKSRILIVSGAAGLILGKLIQVGIYLQAGNDLGVTAFGREGIAFSVAQVKTEFGYSLRTAPILLWSVFAGMWVLVLLVMRHLDNHRRWLLIGLVTILFSVAALAGDKTRVFVMMTLPLMFLLVVYFYKKEIDQQAKFYLEAIMWISVPLIVFAGSILPIGWNGSLLDELLVFPAWLP